MRTRLLLGTATFLLSARFLPVQTTTAPPQSQQAQRPTMRYNGTDGGVRETLESIVIPPKPGAPFTLTLETEWTKTLSDGGTVTSVNRRRIARDVDGRIYQERWFLVPKNGNVESKMTTIQIADPIRARRITVSHSARSTPVR